MFSVDLRNCHAGRHKGRQGQLTTPVKIAAVRSIGNHILTAATERASSTAKEDNVLTALYALLFVLSSFAAPAQAMDGSMMAIDYLDDYFGEITEPSIMPAQIVGDEAMEKLGEFVDEVDDVAITGPNNTAHVPVGAFKPSDETPTVEYSSLGDDKLAVDDTTEQSTMPPHIVATEPMIEQFGETFDDMDGVPIGLSDAADAAVGVIQPSDSE